VKSLWQPRGRRKGRKVFLYTFAWRRREREKKEKEEVLNLCHISRAGEGKKRGVCRP